MYKTLMFFRHNVHLRTKTRQWGR